MKIIKREGKWRLLERHATLLLMDERTLDRIVEDPEMPLMPEDERGFSGEKTQFYTKETSLADVCRAGQKNRASRLEVSYDFFFGGSKRKNYPDSPATLRAYKVIADVAKEHGMTFSASIVSPLDVGPGYAKKYVHSGRILQYKECSLNADGSFEAELPLQTQWTNNKGPIALRLTGVRAYAFTETRVGDTPFYFVDENAIADVSRYAEHAADADSVVVTGAGYGCGRLRIYGHVPECLHNRCLAVAVYDTPEIDYFSPDASAYMKSVIDLHHQNGISYAGFYSDEMHIQFDWDLENHFGHDSEINARHVTDSLASEYARRYGGEYTDFVKYLIYFAYHQHDFLGGAEGALPSQHVMGPDAAGLYRTWLFRKRYFEMLQRRVVDLCLETKEYAESLFGGPIMTRAHSTWQEAPTCDRFFDMQRFSQEAQCDFSRYDYTPDYVWSSSIRENISACYDYFKWNEYLTGGGTDHPEGGFLDRCYYGSAFACSLALQNKFPFSYYGFWGGPKPVMQRLAAVGVTYGNQALGFHTGHNFVQGLTPRVSEVLTVYPLDLNYVEERFGSWMVQYGYTDYTTEEQLCRRFQRAEAGSITVGDRSYKTLLILYSPLAGEDSLRIAQQLIHAGGLVVWTSSPALGPDGAPSAPWQKLFGLQPVEKLPGGTAAPERQIRFSGALAGVAPMHIPTGMRPDYVYPSLPAEDVEILAKLDGFTLGSLRRFPSGGRAVYLGFRPRDDQSGSLGEDVSTLFDILCALGAYTPGGPEAQSRPAGSRYIHNRFPNGAVTIANHMRTIRENWYGSFFRDDEKDREILSRTELTPDTLSLENMTLAERRVTYKGTGALTFRLDSQGNPDGFAGQSCTGISLNGHSYIFSDRPADLCFFRISADDLEAGIREAWAVTCAGPAELTLPFNAAGMRAAVCGEDLHEGGPEFSFTVADGQTRISVPEALQGSWLVLYHTV